MYRRMNIKVPEETYQKIKYWAGRFGVSMSQLGGISIQAGLDQVIRAVDPFGSLNDDQLARLLRVAEKENIPLEIPKKAVFEAEND